MQLRELVDWNFGSPPSVPVWSVGKALVGALGDKVPEAEASLAMLHANRIRMIFPEWEKMGMSLFPKIAVQKNDAQTCESFGSSHGLLFLHSNRDLSCSTGLHGLV